MKPSRKYASRTAFRVALEGCLNRLAQEHGLDLQRLRRPAAFDRSLCETFQRRKAHKVPPELIPPPASWSGPFADMAAECGLGPDMEKHFGVVAQFFSNLSL